MNKLLSKPLALTAGILGLIQGIAWTVFSVLAICCKTDSIEIQVDRDFLNVTEYYKVIYVIFLDDNGQAPNPSVTIKPQEFFIFMCFYLVFSIIWSGVSGILVWAMIHRQWQLTKSLFGTWSGVTILVSIVDIILTALIANDYATVNGGDTSTTELVTYGIVMSLAARGYILWVVNIIFAAILMRLAIAAVLNESKDTTLPIIHGYETSDVNPPWFSNHTSVKDLWGNSTDSPDSKVNGDYDNHGFERSQSFFPATIPSNNNKGYAPPPPGRFPSSPQSPGQDSGYQNFAPPNNSYQNFAQPNTGRQNNSTTPNVDQMSFSEAIAHRTATIGKNKGRRSPLRYVSGPVIPDPDYTPPGSPNGLKSVLRAKSNYNQ